MAAAGHAGNYLAGHAAPAAVCFNAAMTVLTHTLPFTLQQARKARRITQLELALQLEVSQRHVSFVESGRAKPSRNLLLAWLQALDAPLATCNAAMLQAGYAPAFSAAALGDATLLQANEAIRQLLQAHDPMPALVIDANWNLVDANRGCRWLTTTLLPWTVAVPEGTPVNMLELLIHPQGLTQPMLNLGEVGPALLAHLRDDASVQPGLRPQVERFAALLHERIGPPGLHGGLPRPAAPMLTTRFASPHGELAFFSMFTTFGTPQDITLASLRVEHLFPADEATREVLQREVPA